MKVERCTGGQQHEHWCVPEVKIVGSTPGGDCICRRSVGNMANGASSQVPQDHLAMSRPMKLLLGSATLVPLVLLIYLLVTIASFLFGVLDNGGSVAAPRLADVLRELLTVQWIMVASFVVLLCVYLWHLLVHRAGRELAGQTPLWVLGLMFAPMFAMPIYWYTKVWHEPASAAGRLRRS